MCFDQRDGVHSMDVDMPWTLGALGKGTGMRRVYPDFHVVSHSLYEFVSLVVLIVTSTRYKRIHE